MYAYALYIYVYYVCVCYHYLRATNLMSRDSCANCTVRRPGVERALSVCCNNIHTGMELLFCLSIAA